MDSERTLTRKGRATRDRIVVAATDLIGRHGVAGVSLDQVRRAAEVSGSQLYHYFDSKQALIGAVITRQADLVAGPLHHGGAEADDTTPLGALDSFEALRAWADAAIARQQELLDDDARGDCTLGSLAAELSGTDEQARVEISHGFLRWQGILRQSLQRLKDRDELRPDADVDDLAYALLAALQGGSLLSRTLLDIASMRSALDAALAYVQQHAA